MRRFLAYGGQARPDGIITDDYIPPPFARFIRRVVQHRGVTLSPVLRIEYRLIMRWRSASLLADRRNYDVDAVIRTPKKAECPAVRNLIGVESPSRRKERSGFIVILETRRHAAAARSGANRRKDEVRARAENGFRSARVCAIPSLVDSLAKIKIRRQGIVKAIFARELNRPSDAEGAVGPVQPGVLDALVVSELLHAAPERLRDIAIASGNFFPEEISSRSSDFAALRTARVVEEAAVH
jgi:hypothetical protein